MHPESEHGLRVQLATAQHGIDEWCKAAMQERARAEKAESERDALRAENERLRELLMPLAMNDGELRDSYADDRPLFAMGLGTPITAGDVRRARAALVSGGGREQ